MKLWRRLAKKDNGVRNGRAIRYQSYMYEQILKTQKGSYPLLDILLSRAGIKFEIISEEK